MAVINHGYKPVNTGFFSSVPVLLLTVHWLSLGSLFPVQRLLVLVLLFVLTLDSQGRCFLLLGIFLLDDIR